MSYTKYCTTCAKDAPESAPSMYHPKGMCDRLYMFAQVDNEDALEELQDLCVSLTRAIRRLGPEPNEERLMPILEEFCYSVAEIDRRTPFLQHESAQEIREWYVDLALTAELPIASLDDLDEPPSW